MDNFRSPKVVKLEQENQALKAIVDELNIVTCLLLSRAASPDDKRRAREALAKTPQQSLDTLKAEIEEEAVGRCFKAINESEYVLVSNAPAYYRDDIYDALKNMPRKYLGDK